MLFTKNKLKEYIYNKVNGYHFVDSIFGNATIKCTDVTFSGGTSTIEVEIEKDFRFHDDECDPISTHSIWTYDNSVFGFIVEDVQRIDRICDIAIAEFKNDYTVGRLNEKYADVGVSFGKNAINGNISSAENTRFINAMAYLNEVAAERGFLDDNKEFKEYKEYVFSEYRIGFLGGKQEITKYTMASFQSFEYWQELRKLAEQMELEQQKVDEADNELISKESLDKLLAEANEQTKSAALLEE